MNIIATDIHGEFDRFELINGADYVLVDWDLGNTCNYNCSYCNDYSSDGTRPWLDLSTALIFAQRCMDHYNKLGKKILWNLYGGEPTVWKHLDNFLTEIKAYDPDCVVRVITNGSRTLAWWEKNAPNMDDVLISYHTEQADYKHLSDVTNILYKHGVVNSVHICLYPPHMEKCKAAAEYIYKHGTCHINIKALQVELGTDVNFEYDDGMVNYMMGFHGRTPTYDVGHIPYARVMQFRDTTTGKTESVENCSSLVVENRHTWLGWKCNIGLESLAIKGDGRVAAGSACDMKTMGNMNEPDDIEFPVEPVICQVKWCTCLADVETTKYR